MERLKGKVTINGVKYKVRTEIDLVTDAKTADWVYKTSSTNESLLGLSGNNHPITFNPHSFHKNTGAHELLHTIGVGHHLNNTGALTSYRLKSSSSGVLRDWRELKIQDVKGLIIY